MTALFRILTLIHSNTFQICALKKPYIKIFCTLGFSSLSEIIMTIPTTFGISEEETRSTLSNQNQFFMQLKFMRNVSFKCLQIHHCFILPSSLTSLFYSSFRIFQCLCQQSEPEYFYTLGTFLHSKGKWSWSI